jgi:hypothetical protein
MLALPPANLALEPEGKVPLEVREANGLKLSLYRGFRSKQGSYGLAREGGGQHWLLVEDGSAVYVEDLGGRSLRSLSQIGSYPVAEITPGHFSNGKFIEAVPDNTDFIAVVLKLTGRFGGSKYF